MKRKKWNGLGSDNENSSSKALKNKPFRKTYFEADICFTDFRILVFILPPEMMR